jgi:hypothetical protein
VRSFIRIKKDRPTSTFLGQEAAGFSPQTWNLANLHRLNRPLLLARPFSSSATSFQPLGSIPSLIRGRHRSPSLRNCGSSGGCAGTPAHAPAASTRARDRAVADHQRLAGRMSPM